MVGLVFSQFLSYPNHSILFSLFIVCVSWAVSQNPRICTLGCSFNKLHEASDVYKIGTSGSDRVTVLEKPTVWLSG